MAPLMRLKLRLPLHAITLLLSLFQFQKVYCFGASNSMPFSPSTTEPAQDALGRLCLAWGLRETESMRTSMQDCTELCQVMESNPDLSTWLQRSGRISKQRLVAMVVQHPLLLARALTSENIQV